MESRIPQFMDVVPVPVQAFRQLLNHARLLLRALPADLPVLALLLALTLLFYRDTLATGRIPYEKDTITYYYPAAEFVSNFLKQHDGRIPIWTGQLFGGYPLFADGEIGMLFPLNYLLLRFLPVESAFIWGIILRTYLAGICMYAYARATGMIRFGALVAALVFAFGGWLVAQTHHSNVVASAIWLPLMLCCFELALRAGGLRRMSFLVFAGAAFGLSCLGAHPQPVVINALVFAAYACFRICFTTLPAAEASPVELDWVDSELEESDEVASAPPTIYDRIDAWIWRAFDRLVLLLETAIVVPAIGAGLAAVQLLPEAELSAFSFRGQLVNGTNVAQSFTSTYALPPVQAALTLLLPRFFSTDSDLISYWGLWAQWEGYHYIGLLPLLLAILAAVLVRNRYTVFWLIAGLVAAILAAGPYIQPSPQAWLWNALPVLAVLRAPARFMMVAATGGAVLAGWGAHLMATQASLSRLTHIGTGFLLAVFGTITIATPALLRSLSAWLLLNRSAVLDYIRDWYTGFAGAQPLNPALVFYYVQQNTTLQNSAVLFSVQLLFVAAGLLALAFIARRGLPAYCWQVGMVALICLDLFAAGHAFHPTVAVQEIDRMQVRDNSELAATRLPPAVTGIGPASQLDEHGAPLGALEFIRRHESVLHAQLPGEVRASGLWDDERVMVLPSPDGATQALEPNRTLGLGLASVGGYVSLPPARFNEYMAAAEAAGDALINLWHVRYIVTPNRYVPLPSYKLTSYHPDRPLAVISQQSGSTPVAFDLPATWTDEIRVIAALSDGDQIASGQVVAYLRLTDVHGEEYSVPLRAGIEVAEWALDRPDVASSAKHKPLEVAFDYSDTALDGKPYKRHLYYADIALGERIPLKQIDLVYTYPSGALHLYGLAVVEKSRTLAGKQVIQVRDQTRYRLVYRDDDTLVYENTTTMPRAFLVASASVPVSYTAAGYVVSMSTTSPDADRGRPILRLLVDATLDVAHQVALEIPAGSGLPLLDGSSPLAANIDKLPERQLWQQANSSQTTTLATPQPLSSADLDLDLGSVRITGQSDGSLSLSVDARRPAMLVVTDNYYPGWHVYVDGNESLLYRADYLYRAVYIPAGSHSVRFVYEPRSFAIGTLVSLISLALILLAANHLLLPFMLRHLARRRARRLIHPRHLPAIPELPEPTSLPEASQG